MHFNTAQSRSAWTEQEDELLRQAVAKFGDRAWATVANDVPGRSSKSCSDRWRNFLSPDIEHPRKSPFTEWEVAVVVQAQHRYGNNWKAISMLLPGRTNRAVKNLFVGNLKWGARLPEIKNRWLEGGMSLEELLEIKPDHAGGPVKIRNGAHIPAASGSPSSIRAASTSSAGSAWASDMTDQPLSGSPASAGTHHGVDRRKRGDGAEMHMGMGMAAGQSPPLSKRRRGVPSPVMPPHHHLQHGAASYSPTVVPHPGALGPGITGSPMLGMSGLSAGDMAGLVGSMGPPAHGNHGMPLLANNAGMLMQGQGLHVMDEGSPALAANGYARTPGRGMAGAGIPGLPCVLMAGQQQQLVGHMGIGWHGSVAAAAASGTSDSSSPFAALAQQQLSSMQQLPAIEAQHHQGNMLAAHQGAVAPKAEPVMYEAGDCSNMNVYSAQQQPWDMAHLAAQQQQQMHSQQHHHVDLQQQHHQQQVHLQQQHHQHQHQHQRPVSAGGVHSASAAAGLAALGLPGSPGLLQDMRSNDSAMLQQMLEQIFEDDDVMSEPHINKLLESTETSNVQQQQQQHQQQHQHPMQPASSNSGLQAGQQEQQQQVQQYQQVSAGGAPPASLEAMAATAGSSLAPSSLARSSTWPNSWPEGAPGPDAAAAGMAVSTAAVPPAASTPASFSHTPGHHPSGVPLPPRSISATGSGLAAFPGPDSCQAPPAGWTWGPASAGHSLPGSGPPSTGGGMPPQPHLHLICHQLQQENLKLLQRVNTLQNRLNSNSEQLPTPAELGICLPGDQPGVETPAAPAPTPAGGCGVACVPTPALAGGSIASDAAAGQAAIHQHHMQLSPRPAGAAAVSSSYPADNDLPRLPPVATRVGGSAGGSGVGGWATGGLESRGSGLAGLGSGGLGLGSGSSGLGALKDELQVSPDGSFTPGQLLEGCMVDALISDDL